MSALAFLAALAVLVLNGHKTAAGILLVGSVVLVMVLDHIKERRIQEQFDNWRWPDRSDK